VVGECECASSPLPSWLYMYTDGTVALARLSFSWAMNQIRGVWLLHVLELDSSIPRARICLVVGAQHIPLSIDHDASHEGVLCSFRFPLRGIETRYETEKPCLAKL
jgi:hypothetical protein